MPAPITPNMAAAHAERRLKAKLRREDKAAEMLMAAGYVVIPPEVQADLLADGFPMKFLQDEYGSTS
jgi:hypothetical protein